MRALSLLLAGCVLGALAGGYWLLTDRDELPPPPPADATAALDDGPALDPAPAEEPSRTEPVHADESAAEPVADDEDPDESERTEVPLAQRHAPRVLVVRGDPPQPVAEATVWFLTEAEAAAHLARSGRELWRWEWPETFGQRATTDAEGVASLPVGKAPWLCSASHGDEFGVAVVPPRDRTQTVVLQPDETVTLVATTPDGQPAVDVPLTILQQFGRDQAHILWQQASDRRGHATARHFQVLRENRTAAPGDERFAALANVPSATVVEFAGRPATPDPVPLPVPALGALRLRFEDHRGTPVLSRATVMLAAWNPPKLAVPSPLPLPPKLASRRTTKLAGEATVLLTLLPVADPLHVFCIYPNDSNPNQVGPLPGPAVAGEVVETTVRLRDDQAVLAGTLALADGRPIAGLTVDATLWTATREVLQLAIETIADGRFDQVVAERNDGSEFWLELRLDPAKLPPPPRSTTAPASEPASAPLPRLGARVRIPALGPRTRIELGTVVLGELPVLATGIVVDDLGEPIADADVQVQVEEPQPPGRRRDPWRSLPLHRTRTDADGRFLLSGQLPPGRLRVRADTDKHFADSVPLQRQGEDLRVRIDRNGILRGRVLLPDWLPNGTASLQLRPFDESLRQRDTRSIELSRRGGGRFVVEPLRPGRFDALVLVRNLPEPLAVLPDVFVQPGETRDGRLRPLDLREALFRYRLRAVDGANQPFAVDGPIVARLRKNDGSVAEAAFRWQQGRAELITSSPTAEMVFFGRGHQTVQQLVAAGDTDVRLCTTRPALLELPGLRALCGPTRKVRISVVLQGDTGLPASLGGVDQRNGERFGFQRWDLGRSSGAWLGIGDTIEVPLVVSGKYEVLLRPHATDSERSPQGQLSLGSFQLTVDSASWEPLRVRIDAAAVLATLQQVDQNWAVQQQQATREGRPAGRR